MYPQRLQVSFQDSSDEGGSHVAALDVIPDGDSDNQNASLRAPAEGRGGRDDHSASGRPSHRRGERGGGGGGGGIAEWLGDVILRGVDRLTGGDKQRNEPVSANHASATRSGSSPSTARGGNWGYGVHSESYGSSSSHTDASLSSSGLLPIPGEDGQGRLENYHINLREAVLQYLRTPEDFYINMILASLKTGTTQVTADVFHAAAGCPLLIKTFLDSGYADVDDLEVQGILQEELDMVLSGDAYHDDMLEANQADYLRCLCNVSSLRINRRQMVLMRYSGFEFIKILYDCPHLRMNLTPPKLCMHAFFRVMYVVNLIANWLGVLVSLLFTASVIWSAVNWFRSGAQTNNGYWTVICYGAGYVVNLVTTMRAEQDKISQYENQLWPYPSTNLVLVPAVPVFQIMQVITALRYEITPGKTRYFIIRYDLRNGICVYQIGHAMCHAIPQMILQLALFTEHETREKTTLEDVCFWLLIGSACASFYMALFAYARMATFSHSCNSAGFAVMFVDSYQAHKLRRERVKPTFIATRMLQFFTVGMLVAAAVTMLISLLNMSNCSKGVWAFVSVFFGVAIISIIVMVVVTVYAEFSRLHGLLCVPVFLLMIAYFLFVGAGGEASQSGPLRELCWLYVYRYSVWIIPLFSLFGGVCITFLVWLGMVSYELSTGEQIQQEYIDLYLDA